MESLASKIRAINDFPIPGVVFRDVTPLLKDPLALSSVVDELAKPFRDDAITVVAGIEARGFIFGALTAAALGVGFVPLRKPGKLPYESNRVSYDLEYGSAALEMHVDAMGAQDRVLLVDDLIATGGTAAASCELIVSSGAEIAGCAFVIELDDLQGRKKLGSQRVHSLLHY